jgi:hypothetical protein
MGPSHIKMAKDLIGVLNEHFPERLGALFVIRAPWIFRSFYAIIKPLVSANTQSKIKMFSKVSELHEFVDPEHLEEEYGGTHDFDYDHDVEVPKMKEIEDYWASVLKG